MHDYLGCVKAVDEGVGRLLDFLDKSHLTDNTLVICTSDQGFYLGEHGWFDKRWAMEESLRTPLLVRWPGKIAGGQSTGKLVSILDLAQTILDASGIPQPAEMQGRSLVPLMIGDEPPDWRTSFYYHYYEYPTPHHVRPHRAVVTERYKLIHYYGPDLDQWELLDRQIDPLETRSFYEDPDYAEIRAELHRELGRLREHLGDTAQPPAFAFGDRFLEE
jgi:arylsulfatase A-like enzyme